MRRMTLRGVALAVFLALSACGGGGGTGITNAPATGGTGGTGQAGGNSGTGESTGTGAPAVPTNAVPVVSSGTLQTLASTASTVSIDATDADGDPLTATIRVAPTKGDVTLSGSGPFQFAYTPGPGATGSDAFEFEVSDGKGGTASGQVSVTIITPVDNSLAMPATQSFSTSEDIALTRRIVFSESDGDALTWNVTQAPAHGTLQIQDTATGQFVYRPNPNFSGSDSFSIDLSDGTTTLPAVIDVTVLEVNDDPTVVGEDVIWPLNATSTVDVLANDSDVEGGALTVELIAQPPGASATVNGAEISVTPAAGMSGPTHVDYRVSDAEGGSATGRVRVIFGSMQPIFYSTFDSVARTNSIRRYDYFSQRTLATAPFDAVERLGGFITSADATKMVYTTVRPISPSSRRLYIKDLTDDSAPVREIQTGGGVAANVIAISTDGNHIAFDDKYVHASRPDQPVTIATGAQQPRFSRDGRYLFYVTVSASGSRAIHRAEIDPVLGPTNPVQLTATYPNGEGLGLSYTLTPDETQIVSNGAVNVPSLGTAKPASYASAVSGPVNDVRLHPELSTSSDFAQQPLVTPDNRYAYYRATLGGTAGLYATDLQSPGTAVRMDVNPNNYAVSGYAATGDSGTLFYRLSSNLSNGNWFHTTFAQPVVATPFAPAGISPASIASVWPLPDGWGVLFNVGDAVYSATAPYASATTLLPPNGSTWAVDASFAPDSSILGVRRQSEVTRIYVLNPRASGWIGRADPGDANVSTGCFMFPGQRCP